MPDATALRAGYRITIAPDALSASLQVVPQPGGTPADISEALAQLTAAGVIYGVDAEDVARAIVEPGLAVLVAHGRPARDGEDGKLEIEPALLEIGGRPRVGDDGEVDLFDLNLIHSVRAGQILARRIRPTATEPGMNVLGRVVRPHPGKPAPGVAGKGAHLDNDDQEIVATVDGHVVVINDQLSVSPIYTVRGDVGVATGHIAYIGSVLIRGDVPAGFNVHADGDVEIHGNVNGAVIECGGNLSVRYGILGHARVVAAGTVRAKFVENAEVQAGDSVWASDGIVQSKVSAGGRIEVLGRHGSVVGGQVFARMSLSARHLGSAGRIRTSIAVGIAPDLLPEAKRMSALHDELSGKVPALQTRHKYYEQQLALGRLNGVGAQEMEAVGLQLQKLLEDRDRCAERQRELAAQLEELGAAFVDARDICHPEVVVTIGPADLTIRQAIRSVRFHHSTLLPTIEMTSLDV